MNQVIIEIACINNMHKNNIFDDLKIWNGNQKILHEHEWNFLECSKFIIFKVFTLADIEFVQITLLNMRYLQNSFINCI